MKFPENLCLSTLRTTQNQPYSSPAIRLLWGGQRVSPILSFEQKTVAAFRRVSAPRISMSGVQDKISVKLVDGKITPTETEGEFILKPIPLILEGTLDLVDDVPANEHVTMQIAAQIFKIQTAACGLVFFPDGQPCYIVRRFDRVNGSQRKLAQEDFCQLAGKSKTSHGENYKYDGSHEELGRLLRQFSPAWRVDSERLFRLIAFNYVCGNGDAHLKNFSLLETRQGDASLSPAYDLLCTSLHLPYETRTALDFFDNLTTPSLEENAFIKRPDFLELAKGFSMEESAANAILDKFATERGSIATLVERSFLSTDAKARYLDVVADRLRAIAD